MKTIEQGNNFNLETTSEEVLQLVFYYQDVIIRDFSRWLEVESDIGRKLIGINLPNVVDHKIVFGEEVLDGELIHSILGQIEFDYGAYIAAYWACRTFRASVEAATFQKNFDSSFTQNLKHLIPEIDWKLKTYSDLIDALIYAVFCFAETSFAELISLEISREGRNSAHFGLNDCVANHRSPI